ncbi:MAG: UPF0182 family protein [Halanaerobiales bacterium]
MSKASKKLLIFLIFLIVVFFFLLIAGNRFYTEWLWFKNLNLERTFLTIFFSNTVLRIIIALFSSIFIFINLFLTRKPLLDYINQKKYDNVESLFGSEDNFFDGKILTYIYITCSLIIGFLISSIRSDLWEIVLKYLKQTPFHLQDPIFKKDIAFYVYSLPFYKVLQEMAIGLIVITLLMVGIIYLLTAGINSFREIHVKVTGRARKHSFFLLIILLLLKAWDYRLQAYGLLYAPSGVFFGPGYTDIYAKLPALRVLFIIVVVIAIIFLINIFKRQYRLILWGFLAWILVSFLLGAIYPALVQRFRVAPNEIAMEREFIEYNIDMTLKGYGLDTIQEIDFTVKNDLSWDDLLKNEETIKNIRLWDPRPIQATYNQLQGLRPYYTFPGVDVDRYKINGHYQQVMIAVRELEQRNLNPQARNWINQKLKYTHGYGVVMSPVNRGTAEGMPEFLIKDIPPKTFINFELNNPAIYYGEITDEDYVIVNNNSMEFHYPLGDENAYYNYTGTGGVELNTFFKKLVYALRYKDMKILLSSDIKNESRIMYYRNIQQRVQKVAPYLKYDRDPYPVIAYGRLFWIQDAYTFTDKFPYSQPVTRLGNYIRNSIKVVIDAYNGKMDFYVIDKKDPLAVTYMEIFPDLYKDGELMPEELREHLRYPQDLFEIQALIYCSYHMQDPVVFYNREDLWAIPEENYGGNIIPMEPYYVIMKLPGMVGEEFILMQPFTPVNKNNMIAWMAGRSDGENYGELIVYNFPKDQLVYGPMQIESRIEQDTEISQLLTLWGQLGSRVIRGDLLVIPVENSILYVEPVYLQAETSELPELKRVIVAFQDKIIMRENLEEALKDLFLKSGQVEGKAGEREITEIGDTINDRQADLARKALELYEEAERSIQSGNWAKYGEKINELKEILIKMLQMEK